MHQTASATQTGKAAGNLLLNDSLTDLVRRGVVEADEAMSKAVEKSELARKLGLRSEDSLLDSTCMQEYHHKPRKDVSC